MIQLHELVHRAVTGIGTRPRPTAPHSEEQRPVPVMVALYHPGADEPFAMVPAEVLTFRRDPAECVSKRNLLPAEAAMTCQILSEAATKLLQWADLVKAAGNVDIIPAEHLRELGTALAHQGGRLHMAKEMSATKRKGAT